ncbi:MAG: DUF4890 domain-containing protein [Prevotella sp.]|nr:DUF4890 domain-containing protein [Prevotella sp.]
MKKIILTLIAAVAMTTAVAQTGNADKREHKRMDPKEMVEKRTKEMAEKYALSTEQTAKLKALNEKYMGKRGPRPEGRGNKGTRPEPPKDKNPQAGNGRQHKGGPRGGFPDMKAYNEELKAIMNDAQFKAYTADMEKRRNERKARQENK